MVRLNGKNRVGETIDYIVSCLSGVISIDS